MIKKLLTIILVGMCISCTGCLNEPSENALLNNNIEYKCKVENIYKEDVRYGRNILVTDKGEFAIGTKYISIDELVSTLNFYKNNNKDLYVDIVYNNDKYTKINSSDEINISKDIIINEKDDENNE